MEAGISNFTPESRKALVKARLYRIFAVFFACTGLILFILLYFKNIEGHLFQAFQDPMIIVVILFPFLPAAILSIIAQYYENKYFKLMGMKK